MKRSVFEIFSFLYFLGVAILSLCAWWPEQYWWIANLISFSPLAGLYIPAVFGVICGIRFKRRTATLLNGLSVLVIFFGIIGWNIPVSTWFQPKRQNSLTVLSVNLGYGVRIPALRNYVERIDPDVILLQEAGKWVMKHFNDESHGEWHSSFQGGLGLITRYRIIDPSVLTEKNRSGRGTFMIEYLLDGPFGRLHVFNLHLETAGKGLEPIIANDPKAFMKMRNITETQKKESQLGLTRVADRRNVIVAGDFNLPPLSPIFRSHWSRYQDAFSVAGWGFGATRDMGWYGVRIDRILADNGWQVLDAGVGPDLGGDHRPVYARLAFVGEPEAGPVEVHEELTPKVVPPQDVYLQKDFSSHAVTSGKLSVPLADWPMETFPQVKFSYKIPSGRPVLVQVVTPFNDRICLAGTATAVCSYPQSGEYLELTADNQWHEAVIDADGSVKSVLRGLKGIKEWEFVAPQGGEFWVGSFTISK